jgi:4-carboxymuconolactone decarboxylase
MMRAAAVLMGLAMATAAHGQERFPELKPDQMTPAQRAVADAIVSGPRGSIRGPFNAWLRSPELADRLQKLGEHIRFKSSLPPRLNEFAILITARHWNAKFEWYAHYPLAIRAGLKPQIAADLALGKRPAGMADDEAAVYDFCTELRRDRRVTDATFAWVQKLVGDQGVVDLIGVNGYYDLVSMTLNVAEVPAPADGVAPLPDLD